MHTEEGTIYVVAASCFYGTVVEEGDKVNTPDIHNAPFVVVAPDHQHAKFKSLRVARLMWPLEKGFYGHEVNLNVLGDAIADPDSPDFDSCVTVQHQTVKELRTDDDPIDLG